MSEINDNEIKGIDPSIESSSRSLPEIDFGSFGSIAVTSSDKQLNSDQVIGDISKIGDNNKISSSNPQPLINGDNLTSLTNSLSSQEEISSVKNDNQDFSQIKSLASFPSLSTTSIVSDSNPVDKSDPIPVDKPDPIKPDEKYKNLSPDSLSLENKINSDLQPSGSLDSASQLGSSNSQLVSSDLASQPSSLDTSIQSSDMPNQEVNSVSKVIQNNSQEDRRDLEDNSQNSQKKEISSANNPVVLSPKNIERTTSNDDDPFSTAIPDIDIVFSKKNNNDQNLQPKLDSKPDQEIDLILGKDLNSKKNLLQQNQPQDQNQDLRVSQYQQSEENLNQIQDQRQTLKTQDKPQNLDNQQTQNNQQIETQDTGQQIPNLPSSAYKQLPSNREQITSVVDGKELYPSLKLFELTQTSPDQLGVGESGSSIKDLEKIDVNKIQNETPNDSNKKDSDDPNKLTQKNDQNPDYSNNSSSISKDQKPSSSETNLSSKQEVLDPINSSDAKKFVDDESAEKNQGFFQRLLKKNAQKTTRNVSVR